MAELYELVEQCATVGCDRVAQPGLERCAPCTVAFMDGQAKRDSGAPLTAGRRVVPLTPALRRDLEIVREECGTAGRCLRAAVAQRVHTNHLDILKNSGHIRFMQRGDGPGREPDVTRRPSMIAMTIAGYEALRGNDR